MKPYFKSAQIQVLAAESPMCLRSASARGLLAVLFEVLLRFRCFRHVGDRLRGRGCGFFEGTASLMFRSAGHRAAFAKGLPDLVLNPCSHLASSFESAVAR